MEPILFLLFGAIGLFILVWIGLRLKRMWRAERAFEKFTKSDREAKEADYPD